MADQKLYSQTLQTSIAETDRIAFAKTGDPITGAKNIVWSAFKDLIKAITFNKINLAVDSGVTLTGEGQIKWNDKYYTLEYDSGLGYTVTIGNQTYIVFYNDTGVEIQQGRMMHLVGGASFEGEIYPTFELADPRTWEKVQGTLGMTFHTVAIGALGLLAKDAQKVSVDTSSVSVGSQLWIKADGSGTITDIKPQFPNIAISIGGAYDSAVDGCVFFNITSGINEIFDDAWDGSILEGFDFVISTDGITVLGVLSNKDTSRDLAIQFSTGFYTFDTTPAAPVLLTTGTDTNPQLNYIYILESTKALTVSTSGFPLVEHAKVAQVALYSAAKTQANGGAIRNQNINDHIKTTGDNGHILHIAERLRQFNAEWDNGTEGSLDATGGNGYISVTGGEVWQLHKQSFPALDMAVSDTIRIVNDFTTAYRETTNLNTITAFSDGSSWSNEWSKIVVWGVANKSGEASFLMCNIPSDGYNSEANAIADALNYADYSIPETFKGVGFLIGAFVIRISGGSITYNGGSSYQDLRGFIPNNVAGGGGGGGGVTSFLGLTDTPSAYTGQAGKFPKVNSGESSLEFVSVDESLIYESSGWWSTLNTVTENVLELDLNRTQVFIQKAGTIKQIKLYIEDLGTNPNGIEVNFVVGLNDLILTDQALSAGWNTFTTLQNTSVSENDEIQLAVRIGSGNDDIGDFSLFITVE